MLSRSLFGFMLPGLILAAGCTARPEPEQRPPPTTVARTLPPRVYPTPPSKEETAATGIRQVTLHVPEMTARLRLTWLSWPNEVQEALSGLPGVDAEAMKIELKKDLIQIRYDAAKVSPLEMVKTIARHGFEAKIVAGPSPAGGE